MQNQILKNIPNWYLGMLPKVMNKCILLHTPYLQNEKTKNMYNTNREFHKHFGKK